MLQIQFVSFSSYDRIFPEWFLAEVRPQLELALLPLQQSFPQRLMQLLLEEVWTRLLLLLKFPPLERSLLILQVLGQHPELLLVLEPSLLSCSLLLAQRQVMERQLVTLLSFLNYQPHLLPHHFQFLPLQFSLLQEAQSPFHQLVVKLLQDWPLFEQVQKQLETPLLVPDLHESLKFLFLQHEVPLLALLERQLKQVDELLQFAL